jgi:hypothetical protein
VGPVRDRPSDNQRYRRAPTFSSLIAVATRSTEPSADRYTARSGRPPPAGLRDVEQVRRQLAVHLRHARTADPCDETKRGYASDLGERSATLLGASLARVAQFGEDRIFRMARRADDERNRNALDIARSIRRAGGFLRGQPIEAGAGCPAPNGP